MILAKTELMEIMEPQLAMFFNVEAEVVDFSDMKIVFYIKSSDGHWVEGYVEVDYDTDLAVYLARPERHGGGWSYAGDILWCDILPEGIE